MNRLRKSESPLAKLVASAIIGFVAATGTGFAQDTGKDIQDRVTSVGTAPGDAPATRVVEPPTTALREELEESSDWALAEMADGLHLRAAEWRTRHGLIDELADAMGKVDPADYDHMLRSAHSKEELETAWLLVDVWRAAGQRVPGPEEPTS